MLIHVRQGGHVEHKFTPFFVLLPELSAHPKEPLSVPLLSVTWWLHLPPIGLQRRSQVIPVLSQATTRERLTLTTRKEETKPER